MKFYTFVVLSVHLCVAAAATTTFSTDPNVASSKTFDYVIAGGGLTGIVVANKLSAKGFSVLIVEAGKDLRNVEGIYNAEKRNDLNNDPENSCNWQYVATGDDGNPLSVKVDSGKCLGGSTSINGMVWDRPTVTELDFLAALGNPGWDAAGLTPLMEEAEHNTPPTPEQRAAGADVVPFYHGHSGPIITSFATPPRIPLAQAIYQAAMKSVFGSPTLQDMSARNNSGTAHTMWTIVYDATNKINRRVSAAYGWLYPTNEQRDSLTVLTNHIVAKVVLSGTKATGLQFGVYGGSGGPFYTVTARKEVILAAGSLGTPPILERSGIGNKSVLDQFNIEQVVDLPGVGLNLQDQPGTSLSALIDNVNATNTGLVDNRNLFAPIMTVASVDEILKDGAANAKTSLAASLSERAQAAVNAGVHANLAGSLAIFGRQIELIVSYDMPVAEIIGESYPSVFTTIFWPLLPLSRGHIHINTTDPFAPPRITPRFYTDDWDVSLATSLAKSARSMFSTTAFQSVVANPAADGVPANATDAQWAQWLKDSSYGASHWIGSSAMLPLELGGVVSPKLQVYGTQNLRIVDASIIPIQLTSHTMPMAYSIALKASQLIIADS